MPKDRYQTVQDVADRLKVGEATVRHWIKEGALRAIDIGKGWRISDADLEDFLRRHETRPRETGPCSTGPLPNIPAMPSIRSRTTDGTLVVAPGGKSRPPAKPGTGIVDGEADGDRPKL